AAVDKADRGESNIYKVHVLQAMVWSRRAWASIEPAKIRNCFRHTGIMRHDNDEIQFSDQDLQAARDSIDHNMRLLSSDQQIFLEEFIEPTGENEGIHIHLTDAELLEMPIDGVEMDRTEEGEGEGEEDEEEEEEEGPPPRPSKDILAAMDLVMKYIDGDLGPIEYPEEGDTYASTQKRLKGWREALHRKMLANMTQSAIPSFFKPT
ncbi:hypothetical protein BGZ89_006715, partial [Linnemannia elongata]